jgi:hypothetical protein
MADGVFRTAVLGELHGQKAAPPNVDETSPLTNYAGDRGTGCVPTSEYWAGPDR